MTAWTPLSKHTSSFSNTSKHASSFANVAKSATNSLLLLEDGFYLLLETSDKMILEQSVASYVPSYTNITKH